MNPRCGVSLGLFLPYAWLLVFFLAPFLIVAAISLGEAAIGIPPYTPPLSFAEGWVPTLAVNFGNSFERWTGGRIKATPHRVLGSGRPRFSIPFFFEPRADAVIAPLPLAGIEPFQPFLYGDHLWATTTRFVEFQGLENLRKPRGNAAALGKALSNERRAVEVS